MESADAKAEAEGLSTREQVVAMMQLNDDPQTPDAELIKALRRRANTEQECANTRETTLMDMRSSGKAEKDPVKYARVKQQKAIAESNVKQLLQLRNELAAAAHENAS